MATIQVKTGSGAPPTLAAGEPAFDTAGHILYVGDGATNTAIGPVAGITANQKVQPITVMFGDGATVPATGNNSKTWTCPFDGTISAWYISAQPAGACVIDVWKKAGAVPTNAESITNGHEPTLAATNSIASNTNLANWTSVAVAVGDVFMFNLDSVATCTAITLVLKVVKS